MTQLYIAILTGEQIDACTGEQWDTLLWDIPTVGLQCRLSSFPYMGAVVTSFPYMGAATTSFPYMGATPTSYQYLAHSVIATPRLSHTIKEMGP